MSRTRTGGFPIGFRKGFSEWQKDLRAVLAFAREQGFESVDLGRDADKTGREVLEAGLAIGSVDLAEWQGMISSDPAKRDAAVARNAAYVRACAALGPTNHFLVMLPEKPDLKRSENFGFMVDSFSKLAPVMEECRAKLAIEGWPGAGALCCTPEGLRAFFERCPSPAFGINYDPSHLIRMGIDPLRFVREFSRRIHHVHGKDTEELAENRYVYGCEQPPTFGKTFSFGSMSWRYCIPGHGVMSWGEAFRHLKEAGYAGRVSIELEDGQFNGSVEGEKLGLKLARAFLEGC